MIHKRSIIITEDEQVVFRHDNNNLNKNNHIEKDMINAIIRLTKTGNFNMDKFCTLVKKS